MPRSSVRMKTTLGDAAFVGHAKKEAQKTSNSAKDLMDMPVFYRKTEKSATESSGGPIRKGNKEIRIFHLIKVVLPLLFAVFLGRLWLGFVN